MCVCHHPDGWHSAITVMWGAGAGRVAAEREAANKEWQRIMVGKECDMREADHLRAG